MVSGKGLGINRTQLLKLCDKHFKPNSEVMHIETKQEFNKLFNELESYSRLGLHNWHFTLYYSYGDKNMYIYLHQCCLKNIHPTNKESLLAFLSDFNELVDKKLTLKTKGLMQLLISISKIVFIVLILTSKN
jgi:hypothetical protein